MAKKLVKFLFGAVLLGIAVAGGIAYLNKLKKTKETKRAYSEENTDDLSTDLEEKSISASGKREYVTIPKESRMADMETDLANIPENSSKSEKPDLTEMYENL